MSDDRRIEQLFREALQRPAADRDRFVEEASDEDDDLAAEVRSLLAHHREAGGFLDTPAVEAEFAEAQAESGGPARDRRVGAYRIIEVLGEGGMGVVYLAEQESPRRTVALKVLKSGAVTPSVLHRFAHEAELLARLQHPGVAQIYEAGTTDTGSGPQPFFAMEHVRGLPLETYLDRNDATPRQRLDLLARICDAVHHAHQKGVIHRDLKPANILVDESGQPKVLDFGVARAADSDLQLTSQHTVVGQIVGTIPYMSPEQAGGESDQLDTRSDVYALGVLCYELLAGAPPYDLSKKMLHEAVRVIRESDPAPLSSVSRVYRGDVETIVAKALEKERERRYQSASDLAADIRRYLNDEPIAARPASAIYQLRKLARRNRTLFASAAAVLVLLVVGIAVTSWLAVQLDAERDTAVALRDEALQLRDAAEEEATIATAIARYLQDVFGAAELYRGGKDATIAEAIDWAAENVTERFADRPDVAARIHARLGSAYFDRGDLDAAIEQTRAALELRQGDPDVDPVLLAAAYTNLGTTLSSQGKYDEAASALAKALELFETHAPEDHPDRLTAMTSYGAALYHLERYEQAEPIQRRALELRRLVHGPEHPYTLTSLNNLGNLLRKMERFEEAEPLLRENMDRSRAALTLRHPNTITSIYNYADLLRVLERYDDSEPYFQEAIELGQASLPTGHWLIGLYRCGYGELLREVGRLDESEPHLLSSYHQLEEALGAEHDRVHRAAARLTLLYEAWDKPSDAQGWRTRSGAAGP